MIPDFPTEKEKLMEFWNKYLVNKAREFSGIWGTVPAYTNHEGHKWILNRSDGTSEDRDYHLVQSEMTVEYSEVPKLTPEKVREKLDRIAQEMARQQSQTFYSELSKALKEAGNEVNGNGKELSQELFLEMLEKMALTFDENRNWEPPTLIMSPEMWEANEEKMKQWEEDSEFNRKHKELLDRKREEWRDRENCRKLVD